MVGKRLAVLIDGDNFTPDLAAKLFDEVSKQGVPTIKRVYGTASGINGWREKSRIYSVALRELTPGKNAADMALAIDAMDILHDGKIDGFCLVSSDSDFAALATRLREDGVSVHGFGESKTATAFRQACDAFKALERPKEMRVEQQPKSGITAAKPAPEVRKPPQPTTAKKPSGAQAMKQSIVALAKGRASISLSELGTHIGKAKPGEGSLKKRLLRLGLSVDAKGMVAVPLHLVA